MDYISNMHTQLWHAPQLPIFPKKVMLHVGNAIDATLGVTFGLSTLAAAACGQCLGPPWAPRRNRNGENSPGISNRRGATTGVEWDISGYIWIHLITTSRLATSLEFMIRSISQTTEPLRLVNSDQEKSSHVNSGLINPN